MATFFDWLYPELDAATRQAAAAKIERAADEAVLHVRGGQAPFFYSRTPGALAGLAVAGLALHGVSRQSRTATSTCSASSACDEYFKAYAWVDGAATGATYTMNYTYVDLPSICAAWWSATGQKPSRLDPRTTRRLAQQDRPFYLWYMRPGFAFTHINDQFRGNWDSHDEFCQGLDIACYVTRNGHGRDLVPALAGTVRLRPSTTRVTPTTSMFRDPSHASPTTNGSTPGRALRPRQLRLRLFPQRLAGRRPARHRHARLFPLWGSVDVHGGVAAGEFQVFATLRWPLAAADTQTTIPRPTSIIATVSRPT